MNKQDKEKLTSHIERNQLMTEVSMFGRTAEIDVVPSDRLLDLIDELASPVKAKLAKHWNEDLGDCLWWNYPIEEPPYCGTPLDDDFPKYKTHFTELYIPDEVEQEQKWKIINDQNYCLTSIEAGYGNSLHWAFDSTKKRPILFDNEETALYTAYITGGTVEKV